MSGATRRSAQRPGRVAWAMATVAAALVLAGAALILPRLRPELIEFLAVSVLLGPCYALLGAFLTSRRPGNALGWLYCAIGLGFAFVGAAIAYGDLALSLGRALPGAMVLAQVAYPFRWR